jgi:hypothetical protein
MFSMHFEDRELENMMIHDLFLSRWEFVYKRYRYITEREKKKVVYYNKRKTNYWEKKDCILVHF